MSSIKKPFAILLTLAAFSLFLIPGPTKAQTVEELQAQIDTLLSYISSLQQSDNTESTNTNTVSSDGSESYACYQFSRNLTLGSGGTDVVYLQRFLEDEGYLVMPVGVSMGYFGPSTQEALAKYQAANNISPAVGYFGPIARSHLKSVCGNGVVGDTNDFASDNLFYSFINSTQEIVDNGDQPDEIKFEIEFEITAVGDDVYVPAEATLDPYNNNKFSFKLTDENGLMIGRSDAIIVFYSSDESKQSGYNKISEGETVSFTAHVAVTPTKSGFYKLEQVKIPYGVGQEFFSKYLYTSNVKTNLTQISVVGGDTNQTAYSEEFEIIEPVEGTIWERVWANMVKWTGANGSHVDVYLDKKKGRSYQEIGHLVSVGDPPIEPTNGRVLVNGTLDGIGTDYPLGKYFLRIVDTNSGRSSRMSKPITIREYNSTVKASLKITDRDGDKSKIDDEDGYSSDLFKTSDRQIKLSWSARRGDLCNLNVSYVDGSGEKQFETLIRGASKRGSYIYTIPSNASVTYNGYPGNSDVKFQFNCKFEVGNSSLGGHSNAFVDLDDADESEFISGSLEILALNKDEAEVGDRVVLQATNLLINQNNLVTLTRKSDNAFATVIRKNPNNNDRNFVYFDIPSFLTLKTGTGNRVKNIKVRTTPGDYEFKISHKWGVSDVFDITIVDSDDNSGDTDSDDSSSDDAEDNNSDDSSYGDDSDDSESDSSSQVSNSQLIDRIIHQKTGVVLSRSGNDTARFIVHFSAKAVGDSIYIKDSVKNHPGSLNSDDYGFYFNVLKNGQIAEEGVDYSINSETLSSGASRIGDYYVVGKGLRRAFAVKVEIEVLKDGRYSFELVNAVTKDSIGRSKTFGFGAMKTNAVNLLSDSDDGDVLGAFSNNSLTEVVDLDSYLSNVSSILDILESIFINK